MRHRLTGPTFTVPLEPGQLGLTDPTTAVLEAARDHGADLELVREMNALFEGVPRAQAVKALHEAQAMLEEREKRRLALEQLAVEALARLPVLAFGVSVILYDFGSREDEFHGHVAYKTSLTRRALAGTLRELVESWTTGKRREVAGPPRLPGAEETRALLDLVVAGLPAGVGAALVLGEHHECNYAGTGEREGVTGTFRELAEHLEASAGTELDEAAKRVLRDWHCPAGSPHTASQRELYAMNVAHAWALIGFDKTTHRQDAELVAQAADRNDAFSQLMMRIREEFFEDTPYGDLVAFVREWRTASYARLEVGHKLAAALCLTDIPDDVHVHAPWPAWSLVVPDGLLVNNLARVWVVGIEPRFLISSDGSVYRHNQEEPAGGPDPYGIPQLENLIRGACLSLSNPDEFRKERQHKPSARAASKSRRSGPPDLEQARYMLSAPVKIDLREHLAGVMSGRKGASQTVQFLVRGHWRNQAHGPKHSLRRVQWIEPFWKGPEEARILLRQHRVEEPKGGGAGED